MHDNFTDHQLKKGHPHHRFRGHSIISDQISQAGLAVVCSQLEEVLDNNIPGAIVEFGCYAGTTSLFIRRVLDSRGQSKKRSFHAYDSFAGLPPKSAEDRNAAGVDFEAGKLSVSKKEFLHQFQRAGLQPPIAHKAWFADLSDTDIPSPIAFAFLDGDFYGSITCSLRLVWPRMSPGGSVLIDDYQRPTLPGVERAVQNFFKDKPSGVLHVEHNIAVIKSLPAR